MTVITSIADFVERVRVARFTVRLREAAIRREREILADRLAPALELLAEEKATLADAEQQLRTLALAWWEASAKDDKHPHAAVTIKAPDNPRPVIEPYELADALKYALEHQVALSVDTGILETYLQAVPEPLRPSWFRVRTETPAPSVAIAREIPAPEQKEIEL